MKNSSKWIIAGCLLAAAAGVAYRRAHRTDSAGANATSPLNPVAVHATTADKEHEIASLKKNLQQNPKHVPVLLRLAQMSREVGRLNESADYLKEAVAQEPSNRDARLEFGRILFDTGDITGATREMEALLKSDPADVDALYNLGAIYGNLSQDERARGYFEKAVATAPESPSGKLARDALSRLAPRRL
jgi:Flp pilus assembly protein TadD